MRPDGSADAWEPLFEPSGPAPELRRAWLDHLGFNRAAPEELLIRLLGLTWWFLRRPDLPPRVLDAAVDHPQWQVRGALAEAAQELTAEQWTRLVLAEPEPRRRGLLVTLAADRGAELTSHGYRRLAADPSPLVRSEAVRLPGMPALPVAGLTGAGRAAMLVRHHRQHPMDRETYRRTEPGGAAAESCRLDRELAEHLAAHHDPSLRRALARNPHLDRDLVAALAEDEDADVRFEVSVRPELTERQRASVRYDFADGRGRRDLPWVLALHHDPEAMRRCAASAHPQLRRGAARARNLPPDVVELLARDEDRVVRLFLAESCDDAPAELLLEVWQWWTGSFSIPDRPHGHPNFPRRGLLRYADDPNPRLRQLALDDPESTADLVELLSRDAADEVRLRAAADPRLSAASAVRLLDDPGSSVRYRAAMNPRLPAPELVRLLLDRDTADAAVRNPALPAAVMHRMVDAGQD
ncbi:PE-PGRS family protein [Kitasatospora sp. NPDC088346]|uniref:PE-PGRS family protein n=1 Tax=Kitasatospora sp. NPDC088346 TaxID=3364073 RepID=UPI00381B29E5